MIWFHCTKCDKWSREPEGFHELRHMVRCPSPCDTNMYLNRFGEPAEIYASQAWADKMEVEGYLVGQVT